MERLSLRKKQGFLGRGSKHWRGRLIGLFLVLLLVSPMTSCVGAALPEDYRQWGFRAELTWQTGGLTLSAVAEAEPLREGEARTVTLCVTAPASLAGLVLTKRGEEQRVHCGEMETDGAPLTGLLRVIGLLLPEGARRLTGGGAIDGRDVVFAEVCGGTTDREVTKGSEGNREENGDGNEEICELVLDKESGVPLWVGCGAERVEITAFTRLP